ncbi:carbohydrate sulfotransferase 12-like [Pungitius pungitius]|uniref:carbohydrate sulfotransferase 12-like n=1 Tax=Pungitius pungitius TaxID=134920 RepID=UPI002E14512C
MGSSKGLLLLLALGPMILIMLSFYQWDRIWEKRAERLRRRQELRKQLLRNMCDQEEFSKGKHSLEDISDKQLEHLIVDDKHGIIYCYVPKVACTNWKKVFLVLKQGQPYQDPMSIPSEVVHNKNKYTFLKGFPRPEVKAKLKRYTKFLYVRDPFVRLISAYRDKFQKENQVFYRLYGQKILRTYANQSNPAKTVHEAFASGMHISFYNFIQYLLDPRTPPFDEHWRQFNSLCHPCLIKYDFIGHQETFQEDGEQLLKMLSLENHIRLPPAYENMTSLNSVLDLFGTVPLEDRRKLYKLYEEDFRLFGYRKPVELLDG